MRQKWGIVSDLIRRLGNDGGLLNDIETDDFHRDIANIMDYMIMGKTFKSAVKAYRKEDEENAPWLDKFLEDMGMEL